MNTFLNVDINQKYEIKNILYTIAWFLLFIQVLFLDNKLPYLPFNITLPAFAILLLSAIFPFDYTLKEIIIIAISGIITLLICYTTKVNIIFWVFSFIACSKGIRLRPLFFKTLVILSIFFIVIFVFSQIGIIDDKIRYATSDKTFPKHYLGFSDPNYTHTLFLIIISLIFTLYYPKLSFLHLFIFLILNTCLFLLTFCKTSALIIYFMLFAAFFEKILAPRISRKIYTFILILLFICIFGIVLFMTFGPLFYDPSVPFYQKINELFTGRFALSKNFFTWYSIRPFGNYIAELYAQPRTIYLDIGYNVILLQFGYIFTLFYVVGYLILFVENIRKQNFPAILLIVSVLLYMTEENYMVIMFYNISYLLFKPLLFNNDKTDELFIESNI